MTVTMGNGVTSIGNGAFNGCSKLASITLSQALPTIPDYAFQNTAITAITIPASVTSIGTWAFGGCNSLADIRIEDSEEPLTMVGGYYRSFPTNADNQSVYVGRQLTLTDGSSAFPYASRLTFGPMVTTIGDQEYYDCDALVFVDMSNSGVTTIGNKAFSRCDNLQTIDLGTKLTSLGGQAFSYSGLTSIEFPASLKTLPGAYDGDGLFEDCHALTTVNLGSLEEIGAFAFYDCDALTEITIPATVKKIGRAPFRCNNTPAMKRMIIADSDTPLNFVNDTSEGWYGNGYIASTTLDYFYLGRDVTRADIGQSLVYNTKEIEIGPQVTNIDKLFVGNDQVENVTAHALTPIAISDDPFHSATYANATLWLPGGTKEAYQAADYWKNFVNMDFASFVVSISATGHGTLSVADITAGNGESATTLIDRETDAVFTATPDNGYEVTAFTVNDEAKTLTDGSYTVSNLLADQTVAATFTPIIYSIAYDLAGGTMADGVTNPATYTIETAAFTLTNPTREGYTFAGWTGTDLDGALTTVTIAAGSTGNRAYTATWTPIIYSITYDLAGGTAAGDFVATYTIETETFSLTAPTRTGYTFAGWKENGTGDAQMTVTIAKGSTGNKAYTATWTPITYTISYDLAGGTVSGDLVASYTIESDAITLPTPTREHYDFTGWTGTDLTEPTLTVTIPTGSIGNRAYTATWTEMTYAVTVTGSGVTVDNYTPKYGESVTITVAVDEDRTLSSLTVNGTDVTADMTVNGDYLRYTIASVSGNIDIVATFTATKEFITLASDMTTFSCPQDLNFTGSELKAYIAAGFNKSDNTVLLVRVYDVPANTGLVIKGDEGVTYKIPYHTTQSYLVNLLKPHLTATDVPVTEDGNYNYTLNETGVECIFERPDAGAMTLGAQKAYLQIPASFVTAAAREIRIVFEDDGDIITGLDGFTMVNGYKGNGRTYNLGGQQVEPTGKGVYIVNGKKTIKR